MIMDLAKRSMKYLSFSVLTGLPLLCVMVLSVSGCNPVFFNQVSGGAYAPLAPGDTGYVHVYFVNDSDYTMDVFYGVDAPARYEGRAVVNNFSGLQPSEGQGIVMQCPVSEVGMGSLTDPAAPALQFSTTDDQLITIPASAFPATMRNNVDYVCGDTVVFTILDDRTSPFLVSVVASRIDGSTQTGPFSGPDTFFNLDLFLQLTVQPPIEVD
jgi:hypothetical protein